MHPVPRPLEQLHRWLTWPLASSVLYAAGFAGPAAFMASLAFVAAAIFAPLMMWKLVQLRKWGWIAGFAVCVGGAFLLPVPDNLIGAYLLSTLPMIAFYGYTFLLKLVVSGWMTDARGDALLAFYDRKYAHKGT